MAAYAGLAGGATLIAAERVLHHRHHLSDVLVGAALGTLGASGFFLYQERRYHAARTTPPRALRELRLAPWLWDTAGGLELRGAY